MDVALYCFPGSNACLSVELLLEHAGIEPTIHRLRPGLHVASLRARGFSGPTVPAARIDGVRVQGSRRIARAVSDALPESGLLPSDPQLRERVLEAERDAERFQVAARRLVYVLAQDDPSVIRPLVDANYGFAPRALRRGITHLLIDAAARWHRARPDRIDHELTKGAALLDRFDELVAAGVLAGELPNVADFQLAPNLALLALTPELGAVLRERPCWQIAERLSPTYPLEVSAHAPAEWATRLSRG